LVGISGQTFTHLVTLLVERLVDGPITALAKLADDVKDLFWLSGERLFRQLFQFAAMRKTSEK
jgi:hypothetical protein